MAQYFFHLHDSSGATTDEEGVDFDNISEVRSFGLRAARGMMAAEVSEGHLSLGSHLEVVDAVGHKVMTLPFADAVTIEGC